MQTIQDGMIKAEFIRSLKVFDVSGIAETSSALVNRRQGRMIIDACMENVHLMHPMYTTAMLNLFKSCSTVERIAKLVTLSYKGILQGKNNTTTIDDKVADTIAVLIRKSESNSKMNVDILKGLPLKIGKKWRGIASCCVRVIKEKVVQLDADVSPELLKLLKGEVPVTKKAPVEESAESLEEIREEEIKLGILWTYTRQIINETAHADAEPMRRPVREDKVIMYSGRGGVDMEAGGQGVLIIDDD